MHILVFPSSTKALYFLRSQAFELASHFMTFAGGDLSRVGRNEFVPAREFQLRWCHCYLMGYRDLKENQVSL